MEYAEQWENLASHSSEANPFYEHWMLIPALRRLCAERDVRVVLIFRGEGESALTGVFPLERHKRYMGLPFSAWSLLKHPHCFLTTPLMRAGCEQETLEAFFRWVRTSRDSCQVLELRHFHANGAFDEHLTGYLSRNGFNALLWERFTRAFFRPAVDGETYLSAVLSSKSRSSLRRKAKLLAQEGNVSFSFDLPGDGVIDSFLSLEASGWKGRSGSALSCKENHREFFREAASAALSKHRLLMSRLLLDGVPIAQHCYFLSGRGAFFFKPGFDERYGRFSPGLLLESETIHHLHGHPEVDWMDLCTAFDNDLYNRLYPARRTIQSFIVPLGGGLSRYVSAALPLLRALKQSLSSRKLNADSDTRPRAQADAD